MPFTEAQIKSGYEAYTRWYLLVEYDLYVLVYSNRFVWGCPTSHLLKMYDDSVSANHLDVGVGTGYYISRCRYPQPDVRLALMDISKNSLSRALQRTRKLDPEIYIRNVLEPIDFSGRKFDSVGLTYLLHCLPGSIQEKSIVFDNLAPLMNPGATWFGATILQGDVPVNAKGKKLMSIYNRKGFFSNTQDTYEGLRRVLERRFSSLDLTLEGCVAKFVARI